MSDTKEFTEIEKDYFNDFLKEPVIGHPEWESSIWKRIENKRDPIQSEDLMTMTEVAELFKEKLGISRSTFYRHYRKHLTVYYLAGSKVWVGAGIARDEQGRSIHVPPHYERRGAIKRAFREDVEALVAFIMRAPRSKQALPGSKKVGFPMRTFEHTR